MDLSTLVSSTNYVDEFKKHKVYFRNYPKQQLMIVKRKYGSSFSDKIWLNQCRGAIIDTNKNQVVLIPPCKSKEINTISEFKQTVPTYTELVDGVMINLLFHNDQWSLSTRSTIGCRNQWSTDMNFLQMFQECSENLDFDTLNTSLTYSFVIRHKKQRYTSPVECNELVLVEVRNKDLQCQPLPENPGYRIVRPVTNVTGLFKGYTGTVEGIRYKWLTNEHKYIQMIQPNTNNPCLNYLILRNSGNLVSYLKLFPEKRYEFDTFRTKIQQLCQSLYDWYRGVFVTKELEKTDIPYALRPFLYEIHEIYIQQKQGISFSRVRQYMYELEPKRIQFCLNHL